MAEGDRDVEEVQEDHEHQEDSDVEDYDIHVPSQLLQPVDYTE